MKNLCKFLATSAFALSLSFHGFSQMVGAGNSYDFSSDYLVASTNVGLNPTIISIEAWIKADSWAPNIWENVIVSKDDWAVSAQGYTLRAGANGSLSFNIGNAGIWHEATSAPLMQTGKWYHVAGSFDGSMMRVYINGVEVGSTAYVGTITSSPYNLHIGKIGYTAQGDRFFDGEIDEVRIWNTGLSQTAIRNYMCKKVTSAHPNYASLVGYWKLDGSGSMVDSSPSGNNLTNFGATQMTSAAAIGDASAHQYGGPPYNVVLNNGVTDSVRVTSANSMSTIHIYRVDMQPNSITAGSGIDSMDYTHYYGVFVGSSVAYNYALAYYFDGNSMATGNENYTNLAGRTNATISTWTAQGATVNIPLSTVNKTYLDRIEVMLALTCGSLNLNTPGGQSMCAGETLTISDQATNGNYQWYDDLGPIAGEISNSIVVSSTGNYYVIANSGVCADTSNTVDVVVNPLPIVDFSIQDPAVCEDAADFPISGGTPTGGTYSGIGVVGQNFSPTTVGPGSYWVTYNYTDGNFCSNSDSTIFTVYPLPATPTISANNTELCVPSGGPGVVYNWYLNGALLSSGIDTCITATVNGDYSVESVSVDGCISAPDTYFVAFIGLEETSLSELIEVAPNPTSSLITISIPASLVSSGAMYLLDALGRELESIEMSQMSIEVDLSNRQSGVYFVVIESNGERIVKRVVKK